MIEHMIDKRPQDDRILITKLSGTAGRYLHRHVVPGPDWDAAAAVLRELAGGHGDLLAEVAGVAEGSTGASLGSGPP